MSINISHRVRHIFQGDENYCWAAALAMVNRGRNVDDVFRIVDAATAANISIGANASLPLDAVDDAARANHLRHHSAPSPLTVAALARLLQRSPLALFVQLRGAGAGQTNGHHVHVLAGMHGDGTDGTNLRIYDPYTSGSRSVSDVTFQVYTTVTIIRLLHVVSR